MLGLTLLAYLPEPSSVYLIEEPENGIHPKAVEGVFQSLSSVYSGQVLVATHSPLVLGLADPAQLLCFARNPSGAVSIVSGDKHPALRNWRGEVNLATLYAAGYGMSKDLVALVADSQQEATLRTLLSRRHASLGIRPLTFDIDRHPHKDPGVFDEAPEFRGVPLPCTRGAPAWFCLMRPGGRAGRCGHAAR